ncbi:MAG: sigma-70 family RNA polymerase sigma factor [Planctomycetaceae bacterium]|nr:sigma-70 family RNA polymerase sigma factor [Planctomycetaceae bacterium]
MQEQPSGSSSLDIRAGGPEIWRQILARTIPQLYGFFVRRGVHAALAEELTQKTVFDAVCRPEQFDPAKGTPEQWMFAIAHNNLALEMRNRQSHAKPDTELLKYLEVLDTQPLPDEVLERKETAELVRAALSSLEDKEQQVLRGKYLEDKSALQLGQAMKLSEKAVHSLLYRARIALREKLIHLAPQFREEQKI